MSAAGADEGVAVLRAVMALGRRLRAARPAAGVNLSGLSLLGTLARRGPMPAAQLAQAERLQPQSLTRLIAALERDGLIERHRSDADRRALLIAPTPAGRAALAEEIRIRQAWLDRAMHSALSAEERRTLAMAAEGMMKLAQAEDVQP
ncbi:MarR family transcriptional regulator [Rhodovarius crocodyli]|nr:MarR family transcriptional regulator [Rhodovarius crocodyli]